MKPIDNMRSLITIMLLSYNFPSNFPNFEFQLSHLLRARLHPQGDRKVRRVQLRRGAARASDRPEANRGGVRGREGHSLLGLDTSQHARRRDQNP